MEEINEINRQECNEEILEQKSYTPRPKWQIVAAWVGVAIVAVAFLLYCYQIANGGI